MHVCGGGKCCLMQDIGNAYACIGLVIINVKRNNLGRTGQMLIAVYIEKGVLKENERIYFYSIYEVKFSLLEVSQVYNLLKLLSWRDLQGKN